MLHTQNPGQVWDKEEKGQMVTAQRDKVHTNRSENGGLQSLDSFKQLTRSVSYFTGIPVTVELRM